MKNSDYINALTERHGKDVYERLINSEVAIAGLGGLGSNVALALARAGVGKLFLVDFDTVDITNLNRQQYSISDIGKAKTAALYEKIRAVNPIIKIKRRKIKVTEKNAIELFKDYPIVCECFDKAENKAMLINTLLTGNRDITVVSASGMAGYGTGNTILSRKISDRFYICGDMVSGIEKGLGLMAPRVGICAMHQANTVLRLLLGEKEI